MNEENNAAVEQEEELTHAERFHDLRREAKEIYRLYYFASVKVNIICLVAAMIFIAVLSKFIYKAYSSENIILILGYVLAIVAVDFGIYLLSGRLFIKKKLNFWRLRGLAEKYKEADEIMEKQTQKEFEKSAFPDDTVKAEQRLEQTCTAFVEYFNSAE